MSACPSSISIPANHTPQPTHTLHMYLGIWLVSETKRIVGEVLKKETSIDTAVFAWDMINAQKVYQKLACHEEVHVVER